MTTATAKKATAKKPVSPARKAMLGKVHMAPEQLAMDDETRRDLLHRITGKRSSADCSDAELHKVLAEFERLGWKAKKKKTGPARAGKRPLATGGQAAKIRALWMNLYHLAELRDPTEDALAAFVAGITNVDALQWLDVDQADKVIKALRGWLTRKGLSFPLAARRQDVATWRTAAGLETPPGFAEKVTMLEFQWQRLRDSGTMEHACHAALGQWCAKNYGPAAPFFLSPDQADKAIERLGSWVRKAYKVAS